MSCSPTPPASEDGHAAADAPIASLARPDVAELESLLDDALLKCAEQQVDMDEQVERHSHELSCARAATPAELACYTAPAWMRVAVCASIFFGLLWMR